MNITISTKLVQFYRCDMQGSITFTILAINMNSYLGNKFFRHIRVAILNSEMERCVFVFISYVVIL